MQNTVLLYKIVIRHIHLRKLQSVINDLEQLWWLRDPPGLQLGPERNIVEGYFKCTRGHQLSLYGVGQEEHHHAGIQLILQAPAPPARLWLVQPCKDIDTAQDTHYNYHFSKTLKQQQALYYFARLINLSSLIVM